VARVSRIGLEAYVDEQLAPSKDDEEPAVLTLRLRTMVGEVQDVSGSGLDLRDLPERDVLRQLSQIALLRAVYSRNQLRERMADFWSNHFNVYARKNLGAYLTPRDEAGIRAHVLGNFSDLVRTSPAARPCWATWTTRQTAKASPTKTTPANC
jgi:nitrogen fixation protein